MDGFGIAAFFIALGSLACGSCCRSRPDVACDAHRLCGNEVIFSLANQDRESPVVQFDVLADDHPLFRGLLQPSQNGEYLYLNTRLLEKKTELEVRTRSGDRALSVKKTLWVENRLWVVITHLRDEEKGPQLSIDVSYEGQLAKPNVAAVKEEDGDALQIR